MNLNNKGFTLIEVLASVVILSIIIAIMVPSVNSMIKKSQNDSYEDLKSTLLASAKIYLSDNRYTVTVKDPTTCDLNNPKKQIIQINNIQITDSRLPVQTLINAGNIKLDKSGKIFNPKDSSQELDYTKSYVEVFYNCEKKDFTYYIEDTYLVWK